MQQNQKKPKINSGAKTSAMAVFQSKIKNMSVTTKVAPKKPSIWQTTFLFLLTVLLVIFVVILWIVDRGEKSDLVQVIEYEEAQQKQQTNFADLGQIEDVGMFLRQVQKQKLDNIVHEVRAENPEFKDAEYVNKYRKSWTVEIMDVAKEDVILDYLSTHEKKNQFVYFRYIDDDGNKRYKLVFDDFNEESGAKAAIQQNDFKLPASFTPTPALFENYLKQIDDYQLQSNFRDYGRSAVREVKLIKRSVPSYQASLGNYGSSTQSRINQTPVPRRAGENLEEGNNAFAAQPKATGRFVQPNSESIKGSTSSEDVLIIQEVPDSVIDKNSQTPKSSSSKSKKEAKKPNSEGADSLGQLIDSIE